MVFSLDEYQLKIRVEDAMGLSAVCHCGIFGSYALNIFENSAFAFQHVGNRNKVLLKCFLPFD